jgi:hypothetical protein
MVVFGDSEYLQWRSVCDPPKIFLISKFSYYLLLSNPSQNLKLGTRLQQIGARLLTATHLDQSNYLVNQTAGVMLCCPCYRLVVRECKNAGPKPFCWAKLACFDFSSLGFHLQGSHADQQRPCSLAPNLCCYLTGHKQCKHQDFQQPGSHEYIWNVVYREVLEM